MKRGIFVFLAVLTAFALVMTACSDPKPSTPVVKTYTVTFNSNGGSDVAPITGVKSGSKIDRPSPPTKAGYTLNGWCKDEACNNPWNFTSDTVTEDITLYAKWTQIPLAATVSQIKINDTDLDELQGASIGEPDSDLEFVSPGVYEPGIPQPAGGVSIEVTPTNVAATVKWVVKGSVPTDAEFTASTNVSPATFAEGDKLYIKVVNGTNTNYYIIQVFFINTGTIYYGQPVINGNTIDPLWDNYNGPIFDISRITTDVATNFKFLNTVDGAPAHTLGSAKAYWDDQGLYIYATIVFHDYYANQSAKDSNTPTARVTQKRGNYESDSLEIMLNTRYQKLLEDPANINYGQQYRVGFSDGDSSQASSTFPSKSVPAEKFVIGSGNHNTLPTGVINTDIRNAFQQSGDFYAWITKTGEKETGYKIICKVPWYIIGYDQTDQVFDMTTGLVKNNAKIGLEFQLNTSTTAAGSSPSRDGALTWNSVTSQGVTNVTNYGVVTLARGNSTQVIKTHAPVIRTQPASEKTYDPSNLSAITDLTVAAVVGPTVPTANLTYQWYKADDATAAGAAIANATTESFKPDVTSAGETKYYYVVITNTNSAAAAGFTTATVTSSRSKVYAKVPVAPHVVTGPFKNETAWNTQYNAGIVIDLRKGGQPVSRDDYGSFTIAVKFYSDAEHTTEVQPNDLPNNAYQVKWWPTVVSNANDGDTKYGDTYNWGKTASAFTNAALPGTNQAIAAFSIQTGGIGESYTGAALFFEITSITFNPK